MRLYAYNLQQEKRRRKAEEEEQRKSALERALLESDSARREAQEAHAARNTAENRTAAAEQDVLQARAEISGFQLELDSVKQRDLLLVVQAGVRAVVGSPEGLPVGLMRQDETEVLSVLRIHLSQEEDAPVCMHVTSAPHT